MPRLRRTFVVLLLVTATLTLLATPALLFARAGGGQSYSGSHSSGGGGGGGSGHGDGIGWLIFQLVRLCFYYPKVGVPVVVIVILLFVYGSRQGQQSYRTSVIRRARAARDVNREQSIVQMIQARDPAFAAAPFFDRVSTAFDKIQQAWAGQNLTAVRPFISDAVYERFNLQFDEQRFLGYRNRMEQVRVESIDLAHAQSGEHFDHLDVRICATAIDQNVRLADGQILSGSSEPEPFIEIWSFLRRRGAATHPDKPGLMEGNCPNCGGAIDINQNANCKYCGALLRSGQYDWVLAEITQECEWEPRRTTAIPGMQALRQRDSGFNLQELEDKASVIFWRKNTAERLFDVKSLRKSALPDFCDRFQAYLKQHLATDRTWYGDCAVGSVDVRGLLPATSNQPLTTNNSPGFDRALLEIRWSGTRFTLAPSGVPQRHEQSAVARTLLVLARKSGVTSNPDKSISSAHCPGCGAPDSGSTAGVCEFCGATLNDGSTTWALEDAMAINHPRAQSLLARLESSPQTEEAPEIDVPPPPPSVPSAAGVLAWMVKMTLADGHLDARERQLLASTAAHYNVPPDRLDQMIAAAQTNSLDVPAPADREEAQGQLHAIARVALADGRITREENALLRSAAGRLGLSDYDLSQLLKRVQRELYTDARQTLRAARNGGNGRT
ncbi:MAG TPA: TIM44-like domain-containing protein [Tepidisphaeraceae bacterium]|jgi:uncharacterized tellurite resistance protein B-like protein